MARRPGGRPRTPSVAALSLTALVAALAGAPGAGGEEPEAAPARVPGAAPPSLDALLRLPSGAVGGAPDARGAERQRWEQRFAEVRRELADAHEALARTQDELEQMASRTETWQMAAPGASPNAENSPVSYKLRQEIRDRRDEIRRIERRLRELEVEASLAGVPAEWRRPPEDAVPGS